MSTSEVVTSMAHKIICFKVAIRGEIVLKLPTWILKFWRTFIEFIRKNARFDIITRNSLFIFKLKKRQILLQLRVVWNLFFKYSSVVEKSFLVYPSGAATTAAFNFLEKRKNKFGNFRKKSNLHGTSTKFWCWNSGHICKILADFNSSTLFARAGTKMIFTTQPLKEKKTSKSHNITKWKLRSNQRFYIFDSGRTINNRARNGQFSILKLGRCSTICR